jgi:hypothetical protein
MLTKYAYRHIKRIALGVPENKVCEFLDVLNVKYPELIDHISGIGSLKRLKGS